MLYYAGLCAFLSLQMKFLVFQMFPPRQTGACWRVGQQRRNISTTAAADNKLPSSSIIKWRPGKPGHISSTRNLRHYLNDKIWKRQKII